MGRHGLKATPPTRTPKSKPSLTPSTPVSTMILMDMHLQVPLSETEYRDLKVIARNCGQSVEGWARDILLKTRNEQTHTVESKLQAIAESAKHSFPSGDIEDMLAEIGLGQKLL